MRNTTPFDRIEDTSEFYTATVVSETEIVEQARVILKQRQLDRFQFSSPGSSQEFIIGKLGELEREVFAVIYLDNRHRFIAYEELFYGTIDSAPVHPREVVKQGLLHNAAAAIMAHNHPSGDSEPSQADRNITRRLRDALAVVDIRLLDHLVVAGLDSVSFAERGLL